MVLQVKCHGQFLLPYLTNDNVTSTIHECKQLIKILIEELEIMYKKKQVENIPKILPEIVEIEKEETENDDVNIIEDISEDKNVDSETEIQEKSGEMDPEICSSIETENNEPIANDDSELIEESSEREPLEYQKVDDEEVMQPAKPYNLKDFYTFVGNNYNKTFDTKKRKCKIDSGEKPYECTTCHKRFTRLDTLKQHERSHTGEKPFECKTCQKKFSRLGRLQTHQRIHTGEKPFECKYYCKKGFTQICHLKIHERIHTGEKPFQCNHCSKSFSHSSNLKDHERIHTGEKPYMCKNCENLLLQVLHFNGFSPA